MKKILICLPGYNWITGTITKNGHKYMQNKKEYRDLKYKDPAKMLTTKN